MARNNVWRAHKDSHFECFAQLASLLVLIRDINLRLLQAEGWSSGSEGWPATTRDHSHKMVN